MQNDGLLGHLTKDFEENGNNLLCRLLGPDFLQAVLADNHCPRGVLLQNAFKSKRDFCAFYNQASQCIKDCLTDAAIRIVINLHGIVFYDTNLGKCCTECTGMIFCV